MLRIVFAVLACMLVLTCANPLRGKNPNWYNGYVYGTHAYSFYSQGKLQQAVVSYSKALAEARRFDIPEQTALYSFNIGRCYYELGANDSALTWFRAAYEAFIYCKDSIEGRQAAGFIAITFSNTNQPDSAMAWYKRADVTGAGKDERPFLLSLHGRLLWRKDHGKEALNYFEEAFSLYKKQKAYHAMALMCHEQARIRYYFGDYPEAKKYINEAQSWGDKSELRVDRFRVVLAAASIAACLGDSAALHWNYQRGLQCAPAGISLPPLDSIAHCGTTLF
jgi:tetratricopeptide (TPR) repeat protein